MAGAAPTKRAVPLTASIDRRVSPSLIVPRRSPCRAARTGPGPFGRKNNPHSSPAIRGFAQSGFNEVAPRHARHSVRDLTEASRFPWTWICDSPSAEVDHGTALLDGSPGSCSRVHRRRRFAPRGVATVRGQCQFCGEAGAAGGGLGFDGAGTPGSSGGWRHASGATRQDRRLGRGGARHDHAGTGCQASAGGGCAGPPGVAVPAAGEGGLLLQKKRCWLRSAGATTSVQTAGSGGPPGSRACARSLTALFSSMKRRRRRK